MFKDRIAVHFNFQAQKLSLRAIHPVTGTLTKLIDIRDHVLLANGQFTFNKERWLNWREGRNTKVRQFGEVRGELIHTPYTEQIKDIQTSWQRVRYNPRKRPDFYLECDSRVNQAPFIYVSKKDIYIPRQSFLKF